MTKVQKKIASAMPKDQDFTVLEVADLVYPDSVGYDSEGRKYNMAAATTARILRQLKILEVSPGIFWAAKEMFE